MADRGARPPVPSGADPPPSGFRARIASLPKAELHLHLRGAMPLAYLRERLRKYRPDRALDSASNRLREWMLRQAGVRRIVESEDPVEEVGGLFRYSSVEDFLAAYAFTGFLVRDGHDFRDLIGGVLRGLREQNVAYAEITVSLPEYLHVGIPLDDLLAALGAERPGPPTVRWIVDLVRNFGPEAAEKTLEAVLLSRPGNVIGVTLGGAEHLHPAAPFRRLYEIAREGGLRTTVHAGEMAGPSSVWDAVRILGVERIGHGVRAIEDPRLVSYLAERSIPLEVCPTSNVLTGVFQSLEDHPVRALYEAGVPLSINTDDPTFFSVTLTEELVGLRRLGFTESEIESLAGAAFGLAFDQEAARG